MQRRLWKSVLEGVFECGRIYRYFCPRYGLRADYYFMDTKNIVVFCDLICCGRVSVQMDSSTYYALDDKADDGAKNEW